MHSENVTKETVLITGGGGYFGFRFLRKKKAGVDTALSKVNSIFERILPPSKQREEGFFRRWVYFQKSSVYASFLLSKEALSKLEYANEVPGCALYKKGVDVILFDVLKPVQAVPEGVKFIQGNVCCFSEVEKALRDVICVFHIASYGMSGREQLNRKLIEDVNVRGTENIIQACRKAGVSSLVYTSTYNVVFGGQVIENGDESLPYLPLHLHPDHYSRTKSLAEITVLQANGTELGEGKGVLRTCALRPAGIYGPGEQRHLPRIVSYIERGFFKFVYGDPLSLVEFVHVDNLVQAHILASEALKSTKQHIAAGQAYFISDGRPINNFEFFRPLVEGLGYQFPTVRLPLSFIYFAAFLTEMVHFLVGHLYNFQPLLTRTEVYKTGVTHYFSMEKARKELGYKPEQFSLTEVVEWFKSKGHGRKLRIYTMNHLIRDGGLILLLATVVLTWLPAAVTHSLKDVEH